VTTLLYVLLAGVFGFVIGSSIYRTHSIQNSGEALLARHLQANFSAPDYHLMNNITLRVEDGTTQVDLILVSKFGVFVIETKDYKGWIFANPNHASWTQVIFRRNYKFQNPIHQNYKHVRAVQSLLDFLPAETVFSVVVFTGEAEFKTPIPEGVFTLNNLIEYLRNQKDELLSENRVQFCVGRLETNRLALTRQTDIEHIQSLQRRHGNAA
jgi:hypothetical protein